MTTYDLSFNRCPRCRLFFRRRLFLCRRLPFVNGRLPFVNRRLPFVNRRLWL
jgi:uncharacterized C2H2 Zn-finger protein